MGLYLVSNIIDRYQLEAETLPSTRGWSRWVSVFLSPSLQSHKESISTMLAEFQGFSKMPCPFSHTVSLMGKDKKEPGSPAAFASLTEASAGQGLQHIGAGR